MKYIIIFSTLFLLASCYYQYDSISGNGNVESTLISEDTIHSVTISNKLTALIIPSDTFRVLLKADENLHEYINTEIHHGHLNIYSEKNIRMARSKEVIIYTDYIEQIDVSSGANIYNRDTLKGEEMNINASSAADVSIVGIFNRITVQGSSGSDLRLSGNAGHAIINLSSAADLYAFDFIMNNADITASSASDARINVKEQARFDASSAADIKYKGNPDVVESRSSSAADIKKIDN